MRSENYQKWVNSIYEKGDIMNLFKDVTELVIHGTNTEVLYYAVTKNSEADADYYRSIMLNAPSTILESSQVLYCITSGNTLEVYVQTQRIDINQYKSTYQNSIVFRYLDAHSSDIKGVSIVNVNSMIITKLIFTTNSLNEIIQKLLDPSAVPEWVINDGVIIRTQILFSLINPLEKTIGRILQVMVAPKDFVDKGITTNILNIKDISNEVNYIMDSAYSAGAKFINIIDEFNCSILFISIIPQIKKETIYGTLEHFLTSNIIALNGYISEISFSLENICTVKVLKRPEFY